MRLTLRYLRATVKVRIFAYKYNSMDFDVRQLNDSDYETLHKWWTEWGWTPPPKDFLPMNGTGGLMVTKDGRDICAGFLYMTNSKVALTEFVVSDKEYKEKDRHDALQFLIDSICALAEDSGFKYAHVILKNLSLKKKYEASGYIDSDKNVIEMIKVWQ